MELADVLKTVLLLTVTLPAVLRPRPVNSFMSKTVLIVVLLVLHLVFLAFGALTQPIKQGPSWENVLPISLVLLGSTDVVPHLRLLPRPVLIIVLTMEFV
jgi:hypothetical protein